MRLKILYLGPDYGTSRHRDDALRRLGHQVELIGSYVARLQNSNCYMNVSADEANTIWKSTKLRPTN